MTLAEVPVKWSVILMDHMSRILLLILSFLNFVVSVVRTDFSLKSEEMCDFFDKRDYPSSVQASHHRAQQIDWQSALQTSQKENSAG